MHGQGARFLGFSLERIYNQSYPNIQVVISDHSIDESIYTVCNDWLKKLNIKYLKNTKNRGSSSANINNAINNCDGELIKILFQDDFLFYKNSILDISTHFTNNCSWLVSACTHTQDGKNLYHDFMPKWNHNIHLGVNTLSSPSVLTIKNVVSERFDESLIWLMDCDVYKKLYNKYGLPTFLMSINIVNRLWGNRLSNTISKDIKQKEVNTLRERYK